ncbi:MAG: signal transduction histidine kinase [Flavobacterium sp.]
MTHPFLKNQTYPDEPPAVIPSSAKNFRASIDNLSERLDLPGSGKSSIDLIRTNNFEGFFDYLLYVSADNDALVVTMDDSAVPSTATAKLGYGTYFEPWDWVIFASVNLDEIVELKQDIGAAIVIPTIFVVVTLSLLMALISISITQPLSETILHLEKISDAKSSEESLDDIPSDEVGELAHSFNQMLSRMRLQAASESQLKERLWQAQKLQAVGQLTGGVAHDFNNLLTIIRGNIELGMTEQNPHELEELLNEAIKASDRGALLTQRLLAYSRTQALNPQTIDINLLIEESVFLMERTIGENISVIFEKEDGIWPCAIDKSQMENALLNLAINARDAMRVVAR